MAQPFFGRRDPEPVNNLRTGNAASNAPAAALPASLQTPSGSTATTAVAPAREGGSQLTVGPNIKLKGLEITDCDTLVVEGSVEATMKSRLIQIAEQGAFNGAAEIEVAEIRGRFDGELTVRSKLVIHATGRVVGKIRYGKLVVEEGGQLSGDVALMDGGAVAASASSARPAIPAVAAPGLKNGLQVAF